MAWRFAPWQGVLHAPKGLLVLGQVLYVADLDRVVGFSLNTGRTVFEYSIPGALILNDLCRFNDHALLVTETVSGHIYHLQLDQPAHRVLATVPVANGICYLPARQQLVVASSGQPFGQGRVLLRNLADPQATFVPLPNLPRGFYDGITPIDDHRLLISDWVTFPAPGYGKLWLYDLTTHSAERLLTVEGPAGIFFDQTRKQLYLPQMLASRLLISTLAQLRQASAAQVNGR